MSPVSTDTSRDVGRSLIEMGCRQGALIDVPARTLWLTRASGESSWSMAEDLVVDAKLVIVSQDCDIYAGLKSEPRVEAMTARWTNDRSEIHTSRKGNSARLFLLHQEAGRALIADARRRICIDKACLVGLSFDSAFRDNSTRQRFANWVAGRYNRPAVANDFVDAVQKPVVLAVESLAGKAGPLLGILNRVTELRFAVPHPTPPYAVHLLIMMDEGEELSVEEQAELAGWLDQVLVTAGNSSGPISFVTERTISLRDYLGTTRLQLDHFSPEGGDAS